ncbi:MAG: UDP-2,3-diacylglucosamine diphosphatase [Betaproteobacteria bacterium]|nr:UDP-2,3-diacylglucosamine diphosphatase [Betaproteobacteria bacterium]MSQ88212.1 UDP-2,3-diacylglucosamine diphosphatase [Betaproteobacteria bacterium]
MKQALFISDLHLCGQRPDANQQFFRFLADVASRAQTLYVLGDLFEYWAGDDKLNDPAGDPLAAAVAQGFRSLVDAGVAVHVMHGNRDFLLGKGFLAASGARFLDDPSVIDFAGKPVALLHGDTLCTDDHDYQTWRLSARSALWQREFLAKPLAERHASIGLLREKSKQLSATKPAQIMDVNADAVRDAFRRHGVRCLIHGHTHRPARHDVEVDGVLCERWVLPDWYGCGGYLALDDVGPRLVSF